MRPLVYVEGVSERKELFLLFLMPGDVARAVKPPVSTETIRRWQRSGKLKSIARLSDGTHLFTPHDVRHFIETREKLKLDDPVSIFDNDDGEHVLEPRDEDRP